MNIFSNIVFHVVLFSHLCYRFCYLIFSSLSLFVSFLHTILTNEEAHFHHLCECYFFSCVFFNIRFFFLFSLKAFPHHAISNQPYECGLVQLVLDSLWWALYRFHSLRRAHELHCIFHFIWHLRFSFYLALCFCFIILFSFLLAFYFFLNSCVFCFSHHIYHNAFELSARARPPFGNGSVLIVRTNNRSIIIKAKRIIVKLSRMRHNRVADCWW